MQELSLTLSVTSGQVPLPCPALRKQSKQMVRHTQTYLLLLAAYPV